MSRLLSLLILLAAGLYAQSIPSWAVSTAAPSLSAAYRNYLPDSLPAGVATELVNPAKGYGTNIVPAMSVQSRYTININLYAAASTTWAYTLKLGGTTLFSSSSASQVQIRRLQFYPRVDRNKIYLVRSVQTESFVSSTIDSVAFTDWANPHALSLTVQPTAAGKLLGIDARIEQ